MRGRAPRRFPPPWSGDGVWLKGNAHEKKTPRNSQGRHQPDFSHRAPAPCVPGNGGTNMHGTISPQRKQEIDAVFWTTYLTVIAAAAIVTLSHPKPELIGLLLWSAGHPL